MRIVILILCLVTASAAQGQGVWQSIGSSSPQIGVRAKYKLDATYGVLSRGKPVADSSDVADSLENQTLANVTRKGNTTTDSVNIQGSLVVRDTGNFFNATDYPYHAGLEVYGVTHWGGTTTSLDVESGIAFGGGDFTFFKQRPGATAAERQILPGDEIWYLEARGHNGLDGWMSDPRSKMGDFVWRADTSSIPNVTNGTLFISAVSNGVKKGAIEIKPNAYVGINKSLPLFPLHVGDDAKFDGHVTVVGAVAAGSVNATGAIAASGNLSGLNITASGNVGGVNFNASGNANVAGTSTLTGSVGVGGAASGTFALNVTSDSYIKAPMAITDEHATQAGVGGSLGFQGKYNSGGAYALFGSFSAIKTNGTDGNMQGEVVIQTNNGGGVFDLSTKAKWTSAGILQNLKSVQVQTVGDGFVSPSPDGTMYKITVANGGGSIVITPY